MEKVKIKIEAEKCTQCYCCQLRCSFIYTGAFNPEKARIVIDMPEGIHFTDDCIKGCVACALYCPAGALSRA